MLESLHIKNFALIDKLSLHFSQGLNILSGETGAGKSILVGAINLIVGGRGDSSMIRTGSSETSVTAEVRLSASGEAELTPWLQEHGIEPEDHTLIIKRILRTSGRGNIYIQSEPVTVKDLQHVSRYLIDLHGQHEHQSILYETNQRRLLDAYGSLTEQVAAFAEQHALLKQYKGQLADYFTSEKNLLREKDMLEYAVQEIDQAKLQPEEDGQLQTELTILSKSEQLTAMLEEAAAMLQGSGTEQGVLNSLKTAQRSLSRAAGIDVRLKDGLMQIENSLFELEDAYDKIRTYRDSIDFSPERIDQIHERLLLISSLKRKYGENGVGEILNYRNQAYEKLQNFENRTENREKLEIRCGKLEDSLREQAALITGKREETAGKLGPAIQAHLARLGMPKAEFSIEITPLNQYASIADAPSSGVDSVKFMISPNTGEPVKELKSIASGGELSRIMLAIKTEFSDNDAIETLIFDEIDTGIGGSVAASVGKHLRSLSRSRQVLCITHLASIAAQADTHFTVIKKEENGRTLTLVKALQEDDRVGELARMLSGDSSGDAAVAHARELLKR
ncbi:MAG: DNA repair protein RecN [Spirochaetia bacterium]|nr:DNA repair protein RecN [Spirochaetia bacterium]